MANTVAKVRFVKCPKCLKLLPEFADFPMYQCGGCGRVLRAKNCNINKGCATSGSPPVRDPSQGISDSESLNHFSISSNSENYCHERGECSGTIEKRETSDIDARCIEERNSVTTNIPTCSVKDEGGSNQAKTEYSISEDEEEEESPNLSKRGSDTLRSCHKSEASRTCLSHSVATEEEIHDEGTQSSSLSSPAVASLDNGSPDHVRERYRLMSRRTFRRQWGSSSGCSKIRKEKLVKSLGSESFYSIQNLIESSGTIEKRESSDIDVRCIEERNSVNTNIPTCSVKDEGGSNQANAEYSFSENEEGEESLNLSKRGSDTLRSCHKSEASRACLSHSVASEEEILDEGRQSNSLSSPAVGSLDNGSPDHVHEKYQLLSRRTSQHQWGSSSGCSKIRKEKLVMSLGSESFYSIQNSIESEKDETYFLRDSSLREFESTSTKLMTLNQNRLELMKLVEELTHQLGQSYELNEENKSISQFGRSGPLQPTFFSHDRRSQQLPQRYQSSQMPLSYLHCHLRPDFCCNSSPFGACSHNFGCHSSKARGPPQYASSAASSYTHKSRPAKRFFRPVLGSAPFVICYKCFEMLHMPADFLISTNKLNKLKCGACSETLLLTFPARAHPVPQVSAENGKSKERPVSFCKEYGISFAESSSTETGPALNTSTVSSDESRNANSPGLPLHRVMGYPSARQLLY